MSISLRPLILVVPFLLPVAAATAQESEGLSVKSPVPFAGIARLHTLKSNGKNFRAKAIYPSFRSKTPLARFVNAQLRSDIAANYNDWMKQTKTALEGDPTPIAPYEFEMQPSLWHFQPRRLISVELISYQYTGGAHGMSALLAENYALVAGQPKILNLGDLFRPGTAYRTLVETKIFAKLKKNKDAMWVQDGSVKTLTSQQFNNFTVTTDGLNWIFNQYEMGPYAAGVFEIKLSPAELGPGFKREMLR